MNSHVRGRMPLILAALLLLSSVIAVGVYSRSSKSQKKPNDHARGYQADQVTVAPKVVSGVDGLQIYGVSLIDQGTPQASLAIDVVNNRDQAVMAVDFVAGKGKTTSGGMASDGSLASPPREIIPPHTLKRFTWHLGAILEGETVELAAAIFSDGREEGDHRSLQTIKHARLDHQRKQDQKTGNGGPQ